MIYFWIWKAHFDYKYSKQTLDKDLQWVKVFSFRYISDRWLICMSFHEKLKPFKNLYCFISFKNS